MKKIILLDRNVVSRIKSYLAGSSMRPGEVKKLRSLDKRRNIISPIQSIREGQSGKRETKEQIIKTLKKESSAVSQFFQKAKSDQFLVENSDHFSDVFSEHIEKKWDSYIKFIKINIALLHQKVGKNKKAEHEQEILNKARENGIAFGHPSVMCCLAVLYGNEAARGVLKPRKNLSEQQLDNAAYNVMNDLIIISRVNEIQQVIKDSPYPDDKVGFFSFDKPLNSFLNLVNVKNTKSLTNGGVELKVIYQGLLFPDLNEQDRINLMQRLV